MVAVEVVVKAIKAVGIMWSKANSEVADNKWEASQAQPMAPAHRPKQQKRLRKKLRRKSKPEIDPVKGKYLKFGFR